VRLRRTDPTRPGLRRVRRGHGFSYVDADGKPVDAATRERLRHLAVPPAWRSVWLSPYPNGHIQAVGTDDAGRRQYLYHQEWIATRSSLKHERIRELAVRLPQVRQQLARDLRRPDLDRNRVLAIALRLLDAGLFRTGGEEYEPGPLMPCQHIECERAACPVAPSARGHPEGDNRPSQSR